MTTQTGPVIRWTPVEAWLIAEVAKRSLVAELDGESFAASDRDDAAFFVEIEASADEISLVLRIARPRARIALAPTWPSGHRWRDGWMLELVRGPARWFLSARSPVVELDDEIGPVRAYLRVQHRAITRALDGTIETVPVVELACHRYTRQSTVRASPGAHVPPPWMTPTAAESRPWWELDLGRAMCVAWLRFDLAPPPPGARVIVRGYGFLLPDGRPPPHSELLDVAADALATDHGTVTVVVDAATVARFVSVELVAADGSTVELAITGAEVLASELYADTLEATVRRAFAVFATRPLVLERGDDGYVPAVTYGAVWARAMALGRALAQRLEHGDARVVLVVMLRNRLEWILAELAALVRGYVIVPVAPDEADDRLAIILERAQPSCVICEAANAERVRACTTAVVIACDDGAWDDLIACDAPASSPFPRAPDDLYAVLFTSGSTGVPKGAMRSYATFFAMVKSYAIGHSPRHLSFQPLSHLSERMYLPCLLIHGGAIAFSRGGAHLLDELRALEPTTIGTVPRLFEVLFATYQRRLRSALAADPDARRADVERRVLADIRGAFGSRVFAVAVGSAPVSREVLGFLRRCFADIWVTEGYGSTEVGTIATDGKLSEHIEAKLVPLPDQPPERGEIYVRSPFAITGYLGDPAATAAAFDRDGYFATGDLGERDADGRISVIGRVRNTVKLAQGEFVSAERIEVALAAVPIVDRIYVHAVAGAPGVAALVVPHGELLARTLGRPPSTPVAELVVDPDAAPRVLAMLRAHPSGLAAYELPRGVLLAPALDPNLVTASGKLARGALAARHGDALAALATGEATPSAAAPAITDDDLLARVTRIAAGVLGRAVTADAALADGGVDSLAAAEILAALSDELGREVPLAWWFEARTFGELAARLARFAATTGDAAALEQATADLELPAPAVTHGRARAAVRRAIVTGATGFLGAHLVESLVGRGIAVTCLVRAPDDLTARARLADALRDRAIAIDLDTVTCVAGDLARPDLGLADRRELARVDAIVHAGATVSWLAPYVALRGPNVLGTHALLALAAEHGLAMHHVSTISCAPVGGDEDATLALAAAAGTPYALSKAVAEHLVRRAEAAGLPATIYRPAMIAAHTRRGIGNRDDFVMRYLVGCAELGAYIDRDDAVLDMTPVDYVAEAIAATVASGHVGGTLHLVNVDQSLSFAALGRALAAAGLAVEPVSYEQFRARLAAHPGSRLAALAAFFPESFSLGMGPWPCTRTLARVAALGVVRPRIDDGYVARIVDRLVRDGAVTRAC
ncbi:MAG TPA: thioester reductase domain-containing protein [Kofleriaceae bacterium]|nr:thioester reductase domain-containing protein [Kofleriaceae bacterium]